MVNDLSAELQKAKNGDDNALAAIIAKEMPVIRAYAKKVAGAELEFDDAVQEGIIGLFGAIQNYNFDKPANFYTYASVCIRNAIFSAGRCAIRKKHLPLNSSVPLSGVEFTDGPEQIAIDNENYRLAVHKINTRLSGFEGKVLQLFLQGCAYNDIADKLGCSAKAVDNALSRLRQKLKK